MRYFTILSFLILSACGFSPVYGTHSNNASSKTAALTSEAGLNNIDILNIPDREGQFLRNALIDRFYAQGKPANPRYQLSIDKITETVFNFDITFDSEATRRQLKLVSNMRLTDKKTNEVVLKRPLLAITSHNVLESEFSTIVTEQSARENALNDLARQIERQLALYFNK